MANGFSIHPVGDITRVTLDGPRLVSSRLIERARDGIARLLHDPDHPRPRLILDFSKVEELSSAALAALVSLQDEANAVGGRIKMVELTDRALEMIRFTRLDTVFEMHESESQALADYRTRRPVADQPAAPPPVTANQPANQPASQPASQPANQPADPAPTSSASSSAASSNGATD